MTCRHMDRILVLDGEYTSVPECRAIIGDVRDCLEWRAAILKAEDN